MESFLILGYATNASAPAIEPFVRTARRWHPQSDCRIVLFVSSPPVDNGELRRLGDEYGVHLLPATSLWQGARDTRSKVAARISLALWSLLSSTPASRSPNSRQLAFASWIHPHYTRWFDYQRYLAINSGFKKVFVSDVTDVLFQDEVFSRIEEEGLTVAEMAMVYDGKNVDSRWLSDALGLQRLKQLMGKKVLCIGTVGGSGASVLSLAASMWQAFESDPYGGVEQAYFNDLYYKGALGAARVKPNDDAFVVTISSLAECPDLTYGDGRLCNGNMPPSVVHMYNRLSPEWRGAINEIVERG